MSELANAGTESHIACKNGLPKKGSRKVVDTFRRASTTLRSRDQSVVQVNDELVQPNITFLSGEVCIAWPRPSVAPTSRACPKHRNALRQLTASGAELREVLVRRRIRMGYWRQWRRPKRRRQMLMRLGVPPRQAMRHARSRKSYWHMANTSPAESGLLTVLVLNSSIILRLAVRQRHPIALSIESTLRRADGAFVSVSRGIPRPARPLQQECLESRHIPRPNHEQCQGSGSDPSGCVLRYPRQCQRD